MSIFDLAERVPDAPTWRCPHCRTLQPETSRCRACSRPAVTCASCRAYRPSFVGELGFCANDPAHWPLRADEVRPCWVSDAPAPLPEGGLFEETVSPSVEASGSVTGRRPAVSSASVTPLATSQGVELPAPSEGVGDEVAPELRGGLIEAPHVDPAGRLISEIRRRTSQEPG
jgi:hypothetical protein